MKTYSLICFFLSLAMIVCPLFSLDRSSAVTPTEHDKTATEETTSSPPKKPTVKIMSASSKNITEASLRDYLIGVVLGEIGANYHEEAIKAQAVASHTMLIYSKEYKNDNLNGADISDSGQTHQEYLSPQRQQEKFGAKYEEYAEKVGKIIDTVIDKVILYDGKIIMPAFSSHSNGKTENAVDVWGGKYPYLVSVDSEGDKKSPDFLSEVKVSEEDFKKKLDIKEKKDDKKTEPVGEIKRTDTGMVKTIVLYGKELTGRDVRKIFGLKSSTFDIKLQDGTFIFTVKGYGHGVGMSQNGANYLANQGLKYDEILKHYYKGASIGTVS